jgi:hypothetical protein
VMRMISSANCLIVISRSEPKINQENYRGQKTSGPPPIFGLSSLTWRNWLQGRSQSERDATIADSPRRCRNRKLP